MIVTRTIMLILRNSMLVDSNPLSSITRFCYFVSCFDMNATRWVFAIFIFLSFCCDVVQTQALPSPSMKLYEVLQAFEVAFTVIFVCELFWNLFSNWFTPFLQDGWNLFDVVVVSISVMSLSVSDEATSGVKSLRLVRVIRAMRLAARFQSLRKIINAVAHSLFPVLSACAIAVMVMAVYAILGVSFFGSAHPVYFGDFGLAMFTLFATATMENWVTVLVDVMGGDPSMLATGPIVYFVSYIVLVGYVLLLTSAVVAFLLNNFSPANPKPQNPNPKP